MAKNIVNKKILRLSVLMAFLTVSLSVSAQMKIESFRLMENDLTAITNGTMETDQNGDVAALIKVVVNGSGYTFDVGSLGIVATRQMPGEWWVYVPRGVQRITIGHPQYGVLRDHYFDIPIQAARTYELILNPGVGKYMNITSTASGANVILDGDTIGVTPITQTYIVYGDHVIAAEKGKMYGETRITVAEDSPAAVTIEMEDLSRLYARCRFTVEGNAEIWFNGQRQSVGTWSPELKEGRYVIETRKFNCNPANTIVEVKPGEANTFTLTPPDPFHGYIRIHTPQPNITIADRTDGGRILRPEEQEQLTMGTHFLTFTRKGYIEEEREYHIERDQELQDTVRLELYPFIKSNQFYVGLGGMVSAMPCATAIVGGTLFNIDLELSYGLGLTSTPVVTWYNAADYSYYSQMRYKENKLGVRAGYQLKLSARLSVTPQLGLTVATLSGTNVDGTGLMGNGKSASFLTIGGKLFFFPTKHLALFVRPEYMAPVGDSQTYTAIMDKAGVTAGGFAATAGFTVNF